MPDHVHMLFQPVEKEKNAYYSLAEIMHSIKSYSANQINKVLGRKGTVWLDENYDRIVRDEDEFLEKMNYIVNNPLKAALIENIEDYKWLYVKGWLNDDLLDVQNAQAKMPVAPLKITKHSGMLVAPLEIIKHSGMPVTPSKIIENNGNGR